MATAGDIRDHIKSDLIITGTDYDAQILNAIQSALRQLRVRKFWFLVKSDNLTLTQSASSVSLPIDFGAPDTFDIIDASGTRFVNGRGFDFISYDALRNKYWDTQTLTSQLPEACAILGTTLHFSHLADQAYTVPIVYYRKDATLPTADDTSVWFDDGYDVVRSMAQYIFKRESQHYTANEEDGSMVTNYLSALERNHERYMVK